MLSNKTILVIAPAWVGDVVMSGALLRELKKCYPDAHIDVLANIYLKPVLQRMPEVRNVLISNFKHGELSLLKRYEVAKRLRGNSYTDVYILPNSLKSSLIPFWSNIPHRVGWVGEQRYFFINDIRFNRKKIKLMVERFVALGYEKNEKVPKDFLRPKLESSQQNLEQVLTRLQLKKSQKPILAICPGAEHGTSKRWPWKHFAEVAKQKANEGWDVWILGSIKEQTLALDIQKKCGACCCDLTGKTDLGEAIDLISMVQMVIANDSGLMHVAAALDVPVVAIYGATESTFAPPLSKKSKALSLNLPCSPCKKSDCPLGHARCLYDLNPGMVLKAIDDLFVSESI
jgi:heptosyltransferase-2